MQVTSTRYYISNAMRYITIIDIPSAASTQSQKPIQQIAIDKIYGEI